VAATSFDRNTLAKRIERQIVLPLKEDETIPAGVGVCTDATGAAVNASDSVGLISQGRAEHRASYADGDRYVTVSRGVFEFANDGTIEQADIGSLATWLDNQTLSKAGTTTNDVGAGYIEELTPTGIFISMLGGKVAAD
jgi:hypothetical protein